jgi:TPR repeat protein
VREHHPAKIDEHQLKMKIAMHPDIDWAKEPDLEELRGAYALLDTNFDLARSKLEGLVNRGSIAGMWYLGDAYAEGRYGAARDLDKAKLLYERAETIGWRPAPYRVGRIEYSLKHYASAFDAFSRGAASGTFQPYTGSR